MRMWMVNPKLMCRQHLLGEHLEIHLFVAHLNKGYRVDGFLKNKLLEIHNLKKRHARLAAEMQRRGYRHKSPLVKCKVKSRLGKVDRKENLKELARRCKACRRIQSESKTN